MSDTPGTRKTETSPAPVNRRELDFTNLVAVLSKANGGRAAPGDRRCLWERPLPSRAAVLEIVESLRGVLFPRYFGSADLADDAIQYHIGGTLARVQPELREQVRRGLCFACACAKAESYDECDARAEEITREFLLRLPEIRRLLDTDVQAAYIGDPAATSPDEAIFCYPGVQAQTYYRIAHELYALGVPLIPRIITEQAHSVTGIDIHPGARIDESFFIDHGTGVVIGETCEIGKRVRIYQGVTLGAKSFPLDAHGNPIKGVKRHPNVEDDVIIYSETTILGPITIGRGSVIGGNVWVTHSVPAGSRVTQAQPQQAYYESGGGI